MKTLPAVNQAGDAAETLALVCDALGIGHLARSRSTILMNVENARRRSDCLWKIEHEFFMVSEPDEDEPDGPPFENCLLNWGDNPDQYAKKFGEVLAAGRVPVEFLEQIRRSCDVAGFESNDDSQEQKRWHGLRDQAARILASRAVPFPVVSEPTDNEDTIHEAMKRIDQLGVLLCKSLTKPGIDRMAAGMDFHNAVETELRRMLASRPAPVAFGAEPELRRILREVTAVAITQLFEAYPADTVAEFSVAELQMVSDASRVLRPEQVEHIYRRGFDLALVATPPNAALTAPVTAAQAAVDAALKLIGGPLQVSGQKGLRHIETGAEHPLAAGAHIASGKNEPLLEAICTVVNAASRVPVAFGAAQVLRFDGDRASAAAIAQWANSFPVLDEGEPNASYVTVDGIDEVDDVQLAVEDESTRVLVGDYVTRQDGKFVILRISTLSGGAG